MSYMKSISLFLSILPSVVFMNSCSNTDLNPAYNDGYSQLIVKIETKSNSGSEEQVVFTGDDLLWFNGTTKEIRFKDNYFQQKNISLYADVKFYLDNEYLFSTFRLSDFNSNIHNSPVFYYSTIENKFYINDGYPEIAVLRPQDKIQKERDENMQAIADGWGKFIQHLKKINKYKE